MINYEKVFNTLKEELKNYINKFYFETIVMGISGGIDSTVSSAICSEVAKELNIPFIGLLLPSNSNKREENYSALDVAKAFTTDYRISNITDLYQEFEESIFYDFQKLQTPISRGNVLARLRMTIIRNIANITNGLTIDNTNFTEYNLGFFTVNDKQDYCLLRDLWKTEVYGLAEWILNKYAENAMSAGAGGFLEKEEEYLHICEALKQSIELTPTDGLGISNSDLDQIGAKSYNEVDTILQDFLAFADDYVNTSDAVEDYLEYNALYDIEPEVIKKVLNRYLNSEFKREYLPVYVKREKYES